MKKEKQLQKDEEREAREREREAEEQKQLEEKKRQDQEVTPNQGPIVLLLGFVPVCVPALRSAFYYWFVLFFVVSGRSMTPGRTCFLRMQRAA